MCGTSYSFPGKMLVKSTCLSLGFCWEWWGDCVSAPLGTELWPWALLAQPLSLWLRGGDSEGEDQSPYTVWLVHPEPLPAPCLRERESLSRNKDCPCTSQPASGILSRVCFWLGEVQVILTSFQVRELTENGFMSGSEDLQGGVVLRRLWF